MAAIAKVLAICGATAAGGATCVATGVVNAGDSTGDHGDRKPAVERPAKPAATAVPHEHPTRPVPEPDPPVARPETTTPHQPTPVQQKSRQFNFEAAPKPSSSSSGGSEFGGPSSGGGGSSSGGGGGSGGQFGIE